MSRLSQFLRFAAVGVAVALTYIGLYLALISAGVTQGLANAMAFFQAVILQYACQAAFTFQKPLADMRQIIRFTAMITLGFFSSALITGPIAGALAIPDWKAAVSVTVLLPVQNYILLSLWVFAAPAAQPDTRDKPTRRKPNSGKNVTP